MLRRNFGRIATMGLTLSLALLGGAGNAQAGIDLYLSYDNGAYVLVAPTADTANSSVYVGPFGGFSLVVETATDNFTGSPIEGFLKTQTTQTLNVAGTHTLRVLAATTVSHGGNLAFFTLPSTSDLVLTSSVGGSGTATTTGSAVFQSFVNATGSPIAPVGGEASAPLGITYPVGSSGETSSAFMRLASGYTLYNLTTITLTGIGSSGGSDGTSSVTPVPEPATLASVILALPVVGMGTWLRRRKQS